MSDQAQTQTPTPEQEAELVLVDEVALPEFEEKCAAAGRRFSSPDEVLKAYMSVPHIKEAAAQKGGSVVDAAYADLCKATGTPTEEEKQAAVQAQERTQQQAADARIQAAAAVFAAAGQQ